MTGYTQLEKRIVHLENTIARLLAVNEEQAEINEAQEQVNEKLKRTFEKKLKEKIDNAYGRDTKIGENFQMMMDRYEDRFQGLEDRFNEITELVEDVLT